MLYKTTICGFLLIFTSLSYAMDPNQLWNLVKGYAGSKELIERNVFKPLLSPTPMKNISGTEEFNAQIQCPANTKAITISFVPETTMNGWNVIIKQDTDMDGTLDHQLPFKISGVCTGGFIQGQYSTSTTSGNLSYFKFIANNNRIDFVPVTDTSEVGACVCATQSCSNVPPYYVLGGAVTAPLMKTGNFVFGKSEWQWDTFTLNIFGQSKVNCAGIAQSQWDQYGEKNPSHYYESQIYPNVSLGEIALQQGSNPDSYYSLLTSVQSNASSAGISIPDMARCVKTRVPQCSDLNLTWLENNECAAFESRPECKIMEETIDGITTIRNYTATGIQVNPVCEQKICSIEKNCEKKVVFERTGGERMDCSCYNDYEVETPSINVDVSAVQGNAIIVDYSTYGVTCGGYNTDLFRVNIFRNTTLVFERKITYYGSICFMWFRQCVHPEANEACGTSGNRDYGPMIYIPNVTGTYTVRIAIHLYNQHGNATYRARISKLVCPIDESLRCEGDINSSLCRKANQYNACSWRRIERTYVCGTTDVGVDLNRVKVINETATDQGGVITAQDPVYPGDNYITASYPKGQECAKKYCLVKTDYQNLSVYSDQSNAQTAGQQNSKQYELRECENNICPLRPGETIQQSCNCGEIGGGFQLAVSTMEALNQAAKSIICGTK